MTSSDVETDSKPIIIIIIIKELLPILLAPFTFQSDYVCSGEDQMRSNEDYYIPVLCLES